MQVASVVSNPYTGYRIEAKIPFDVLPDARRPEHMGLNILVNDSDTQDLAGQTRSAGRPGPASGLTRGAGASHACPVPEPTVRTEGADLPGRRRR